MPLSKLAVAAAAAFTLGAVALTAYAQDIVITPDPALSSLEEMVSKRQALMKTNGQTLRSAGNLTGAEAVAAAETLIKDYSDLTVLFPEGSDTVAGSEALPSIWQNFDAFQAILKTGVEQATAMKAAAEAGDAAAYGAAVKAVGATCGQCHQQFRAS